MAPADKRGQSHFYGLDIFTGILEGGGYEETSRQHLMIGEASECIEWIHQYAEMGIEHLAYLMNFGGPEPEIVEASIRVFAEDVMPHCGA